MLRLIVKRLLWLPVMLWALVTVAFFIMKSVPGDPFSAENQKLDPAVRAEMKRHYGADGPITDQYLIYLQKLLPCDWGEESDDHVLIGFDPARVPAARRQALADELAAEFDRAECTWLEMPPDGAASPPGGEGQGTRGKGQGEASGFGLRATDQAGAPPTLTPEAWSLKPEGAPQSAIRNPQSPNLPAAWLRLRVTINARDRGTVKVGDEERASLKINVVARAQSVLQRARLIVQVPETAAVAWAPRAHALLRAEASDRDRRAFFRPAWPDLGISQVSFKNQPVVRVLGDVLPRSLTLGLLALTIALCLGLSAGIVAGMRQNTAWDYGAMSVALVGISVPNFVFAFVFILLFAFLPDRLPAGAEAGAPALALLAAGVLCGGGAGAWAIRRRHADLRARSAGTRRPGGGSLLGTALLGAAGGACLVGALLYGARWWFGDAVVLPVAGWGEVKYLVLPGVTLGLPYAAYIARLTRTGMIEEMRQDYVRTARAKGLHEAEVAIEHAVRLAILPVVSFLGPAVAGILTGSLVVEKVFNVQGFGAVFVNAALNRDYFLVLGGILFYSTLLILLNLAVDLLYSKFDPRVRVGG